MHHRKSDLIPVYFQGALFQAEDLVQRTIDAAMAHQQPVPEWVDDLITLTECLESLLEAFLGIDRESRS